MNRLTVADFAETFGAEKEEVTRYCSTVISKCDFRYEVTAPPARSNGQVADDPRRPEVWNRGWQDNLDERGPEALIPRFIRDDKVLRWNGRYIKPASNRFHWNFGRVYKRWLAFKYLQDMDAVYDFGAGSGTSLLAFKDALPHLQIKGFDYAPSAVKLMLRAGVPAEEFDMKTKSVETGPKVAVTTFVSIEQLAGDYKPFVNMLIEGGVGLVLNVEPLEELYDESEHDQDALEYHRRRHYSEGYLSYLKSLGVEILKTQRVRFGGAYHDGYSYVLWRGN